MFSEILSNDNVDEYINYLKIAMSEEPDLMVADKVDEDGKKTGLLTRFSIKPHPFLPKWTAKL